MVAQEGVHSHTVLDDQSSDGNEGQNLQGGQSQESDWIFYQHVEDEELLSPRGCWVDLVATHLPDSLLDFLRTSENYKSHCKTQRTEPYTIYRS